MGFSGDAQDAIDVYGWPGNVREMENRRKGRRDHGRGEASYRQWTWGWKYQISRLS